MINKVKWFTEKLITKFEVVEDFYSDLPKINIGFSCPEYYSTKCWSDLQTFKHNVPENLGLQISGISRNRHFLY